MHALQGPLRTTGFARLWTASAVSNLGDGVTMVAGPLLLAGITDDPALIAGGAFAGQLPWLLFALISGAFVDRLDRRRLVVTVNLLRGAVLAALAAAIATGHVTVPLVYLASFLLGVGETLADTAYGALLPAVVAPDHLERANARLTATFTVANQFAAKPFGAWLYGVAAALPFGLDAASFVAAAVLIAGLPAVGVPETPAAKRDLRADIAEGLRWLWRHRLLRTLAAAMGVANIAFCAAFATFVLYAGDRLGLSAVGYGFLLTMFAVGGLAGTAVASRLSRRFGTGTVLRAGLIVEIVTHLTLAITTNPLVAGGIIVLFGVHTTVWGVLVATIRQRAVPDPLRGRVGSVHALLETGGAAVGWLLGAVFSRLFGLTMPFWIAACAMVAVAAWRPLAEVTTISGTPTART
ncbi:MFS transporter [Actinoplanes oblitus]|uniref:MFS transporter n=1 Tax=Actinoplanes oblitus TaxID=3040509 RepID=A0ABY8WBD2_9ACTN|nr:MFS transporter [Actinoplanes oblitus]WIM93763.1 MFS transporter [Actinoplanes oblitus]